MQFKKETKYPSNPIEVLLSEWYSLKIQDVLFKIERTPNLKLSEINDWCVENLGRGIGAIVNFSDIYNLDQAFVKNCRWGMFAGRVFFQKREDMLMFSLRFA